MSNFNLWVGSGRLTKDIELVSTQSGKTIGKGSIAVNRKHGESEKTLFLDFDVWDRAAEILAQYTKKGSSVLLKGRLEQDVWKKDGKKNYKIYLVVEDFQFLDKKDME